MAKVAPSSTPTARSCTESTITTANVEMFISWISKEKFSLPYSERYNHKLVVLTMITWFVVIFVMCDYINTG